jgi:hypothetical protein
VAWYDDIEALVDIEDLAVTRSPSSLYNYHLRDPLVSRMPERNVFIPMIAKALGKQAELTRRQEWIEVLMLEALAWNVDPRKVTGYVARRADVGIRAVQRIMKRIEARHGERLEQSDRVFASSAGVPIVPRNTMRDELGRIRASLPRVCAGSVLNAECTHTAPKKRALCRSCFEKFVIATGGFMPDIVAQEARRIDAQHRRDCIEILMTRALSAAAV